ncbi:MAG: T9SS type A sorting domain-containing protein [Candidatus Marinimicrobia bacterium]|nr:T9SS type A sorting domain-containing protein [Candidatus Neomarinimicrobiota bacterium]
MKKAIAIVVMSLLAVFGFAEPGTVHLIFANAALNEVNGTVQYSFDVQAWIDGGSDVFADGMVYVKYPVSVFGDVVAMNGKLSVEKRGVLALEDTSSGMALYQIVNVTDTRADVFALTFEAILAGSSSYKPYYEAVSSDAENPSDLFHIVLEAAASGNGNVEFPSDIPGLDELFWDFERETFSGGLDIGQAIEAVEIVLPGDPVEPGPEGYVELLSFTASLKKSDVTLNWVTLSELDNAGFVILRSVDGGDYVQIASYEDNPALLGKLNSTKRSRYSYVDKGISAGVYSYQLQSVDIYGNISTYESVSVNSASSDKKLPPGQNKKKLIIGEDFALEAAYPNPFNPRFVVPFELISAQDVRIALYDMRGKMVREIADGSYGAGYYELNVDSHDLGSGIYLLVTRIGSEISTQRMTLLK